MRAAVIGAGAAGLLHALALRAHGVSVDLVFDPDGAKAENLASLCGARVVSSLAEIAGSDVEIVTVCSPPRWHLEQAEACARKGRALFLEKPVAVSAAELARLVALPGAVAIVQWRMGRALRAVRTAIANGLLGPSPTVAVDLALHRDAAYFAAGRASVDQWGCGALLSVGIHALDAVCFALARPVTGVKAFLGARGASGMERTASVAVRFEGGASLAFRVTFEGGPPDEVRLSFAGAGVTACIVGGEADPTASEVIWRADETTKGALAEIERASDGATAPPLIVPYLGRAVAALRRNEVPGTSESLPSIEDVARAHRIAFSAAE